MVHIVRKEQETTSAMVRRFMQRVQSSGVLKEAKSKKFYKKPNNRNARRIAALERENKRARRMLLRKLGRTSR